MMNGLAELMNLHPASRFGRYEHAPANPGTFEEQESGDLRAGHRREADRRKPRRGFRQALAATAMLTAFFGLLTLVAGLVGDASPPNRELASKGATASDSR
jgi:hypothetical protein